jgi:hypothetical protein
VAVLGASVAALVSWELLETVPRIETAAGRGALVAGVLPLLGVAGYVSTRPWLPVVLVFLLTGAITAGILLAPLAIRR